MTTLVVGCIGRPDILSMFAASRGKLELAFLDYRYNYRIELDERDYAPYGKVFSWDQFQDAEQLLDTLRPKRVVQLFTTSLDQVALTMAARRRGVPTYHLQHGFRHRFDQHEKFVASRGKRPSRLRGFVARHPRELACAFKEHAFFWRSLRALAPDSRRRALRYALEIYQGHDDPRTRQRYADIRRVDRYIAHAVEDFEVHWVEDVLDAAKYDGVYFIGFPQFDWLSGMPEAPIDTRKVILIDHQFHNVSPFGGGVRGWNLGFRPTWNRGLATVVDRLGLRLLVKQHPGDTSDSWQGYLKPGKIELIDREGLLEHAPSTRVLLTNTSSLQIPFAGLSHTTLIALEIHPEPGHFLQEPFIKAGVAKPVVTFEELETALKNIDSLAQEQAPHKRRFVEQFLGIMDGRAGERLCAILTDDGTTGMVAPAEASRRIRSSS